MNSETNRFLPGEGRELIKKMMQSGGTPLSKKQVEEQRKARAEYYQNKPDYELGNPFRERGLGKTVYRPRRRRN